MRSLRTSKAAGILDRVSTLFYIKGLSLPILLDGIVGSILIKIKWKAVGWTVIVAGIAMSPLIPGYLTVVT